MKNMLMQLFLILSGTLSAKSATLNQCLNSIWSSCWIVSRQILWVFNWLKTIDTIKCPIKKLRSSFSKGFMMLFLKQFIKVYIMLIQRVERRLTKTSKDNSLIFSVSSLLERKFTRLQQLIGKKWELEILERNKVEKVERIHLLRISI